MAFISFALLFFGHFHFSFALLPARLCSIHGCHCELAFGTIFWLCFTDFMSHSQRKQWRNTKHNHRNWEKSESETKREWKKKDVSFALACIFNLCHCRSFLPVVHGHWLWLSCIVFAFVFLSVYLKRRHRHYHHRHLLSSALRWHFIVNLVIFQRLTDYKYTKHYSKPYNRMTWESVCVCSKCAVRSCAHLPGENIRHQNRLFLSFTSIACQDINKTLFRRWALKTHNFCLPNPNACCCCCWHAWTNSLFWTATYTDVFNKSNSIPMFMAIQRVQSLRSQQRISTHIKWA